MPEMPQETDPNETVIFAAELGGQVPTIDLHGFTRDWAKNQLDSFLHHAFMQGDEVIKIIHGRGGGWLRQMVHEYLAEQEKLGLVAKFRGSNNPAEQNAVIFAALHRKS